MTFKVSKKDVASLVAATFPEYTGRMFRVNPSGKVTFSNLHWEGGSCSEYTAVALDGGEVAEVPAGISPWSCPNEGKTVEIPEGFVMVERSWFCGKDCGITVYCNPANLPRLLPGKVA